KNAEARTEDCLVVDFVGRANSRIPIVLLRFLNRAAAVSPDESDATLELTKTRNIYRRLGIEVQKDVPIASLDIRQFERVAQAISNGEFWSGAKLILKKWSPIRVRVNEFRNDAARDRGCAQQKVGHSAARQR